MLFWSGKKITSVWLREKKWARLRDLGERFSVKQWNLSVISSHFPTEVSKYEPSDGYVQGVVTCIITSLDTPTQTWAWASASFKMWRGIGNVWGSRTGCPAEQGSMLGCLSSASQNCLILRRTLCQLISVVQFKLRMNAVTSLFGDLPKITQMQQSTKSWKNGFQS